MADHNDGDDEDGPAAEPGDTSDTSDLGNVVHGPWWVEGECPSASIFAEYLDDCLPEPQRQRVYDHLCECSRCRHDRTLIIALLLEIASLGDEGLERVKGVARTSLRVLVGPWADMAKTNDDERDRREADSAIPAADEALLAPVVPPTRIRHTVAVAVTAACLAALVAGGSVFFLGPRASVRADRSGPAVSAQLARPVVARFTGRFPWAPAIARSGEASAEYERFLPRDAVHYLLTAERRGRPPEAPNPSMLGMVGASQVLTGRVEPGVETLRRASAAEPRSAELLSDLGAALLARTAASEPSRKAPTADVATENRDADYPAALEAIEHALELSPGLEEALFNRALALEQLQLWRAARKAWEAYLEVDADSPWAREARWRMAAIAIPTRSDPARIRSEIVAAAAGGTSDRLAELVTAHRQLTRRGVEEELLPGWGEAWLSGDLKEADRQVRVARAIAEEWETRTGDRTLRDAVAEIDTATGPALKALASGYGAYGQANRAFDAFDLEAAQAAAARAIAVLPRTSPAYTWAALVRLACIAYRNGEIGDEARELIASAAADPSSVGRAQWIVGLWLTKRGDPAAGLFAYRQALEAYERLDELDSIVWLQFLIGDAYARMGLSPAAWKYHRLALASAPALADAQRAQTMLVATATLAVFEGRNRVAVHLLDEALTQPDPIQPSRIAEAYLWRSRALRQLGRVTEARRDFEDASVWLTRDIPLKRKYLSGELNLVAGLLEVDSHRAVDRLSRSLAAFSEFGPASRLPGVLLARARAYLDAGDDAAADSDLRRGLALLRRPIGGNTGEAVWTRRLEDREQLFEERVSLALRQGDPERALAIAEESREDRWRAPPSRIPGRVEALRAVQIRARLDAGTTVLYYEWLPNRVVMWRLRADDLLFVDLPSKPAELAQLISTFATDLSAGAWTAATRNAAVRLHAALVHPAALKGERLVIVPDGELNRLPFAALIDPESRHFLLEDHELTIAPSAGDFLDGHARWQAQSPLGDALVVGDPLLDQTLLPGMRPLEGARREARMIAALYPHPTLLLGGGATRSAFLAALGRRAVAHFAGHSIANDADPEQSSLALADQGNGANGLLTASEIARLDLTETHAVVLSGCDTGVGDGGEGSLSVARAFLVAGAPDVVASLWPIADVPSVPLMTAFHRRLRAGERPATALRGAQLELLQGHDPALQSPGVWAAFEAFGG